MDENAARQVLLAQAIEECDTDGRLVDAAARDRVDRQARQDALGRAPGPAHVAPDEFVHIRAQRVLAEAAVREPAVVALRDEGAWRPLLEWGLPLGALVVGVLTDVVGNPHRLDLVSLPLLGIVAWNIVVYLLLAVAWLVPGNPRAPWVGRLAARPGAPRWRRRAPGLATQVAMRFQALWWPATQPLAAARWKRVLHLCAAAWAVGVILSLLVRGLVVEYKVGWESTFLGPAQVYAILEVLRWPALLVLPFETFTVLDVAQLRFSDGGGAVGGAPWVWMYVALLLTVVVLPRLVLATFAAWRETRLGREVAVPLASDYYRRIVSLLDSALVTFGVVTHREADREALMAVLAGEADGVLLVVSDFGDALRLVELPLARLQPVPPRPWWQRWKAPPPRHPSQDCDVVLHVVGDATDEAAAAPVLASWQRPVLHIAMHGIPVGEGGIAFDEFAASPRSVRRLWLAAAPQVREDVRPGYDRIVQAWDARESRRLHAAMEAVARYLVDAARQSEEVPGSALGVRHLLPGERQSQLQAREAAMTALVERLESSARDMLRRLCELHGVAAGTAEAIDHRLREQLSVQQAIDAPQAGVAGAATGAAMGASVDLLAGGLTLGAAAALGALVGGGAAFLAAAWKNRTAPDGGTAVQLGDAMLLALAETALLRYLAISHRGRVEADWPAQVARSLGQREAFWPGYWAAARQQPDAHRLVEPLATELQAAIERLPVPQR